MKLGSGRWTAGWYAVLLLAAACGSDAPSPPAERTRSSCPPEWEHCYQSFLPAIYKDYPYRPRGFGVAGNLEKDQHDFWYYSWGYGGTSIYNDQRFLPMIWGGPPSTTCDPAHSDFDPNADCTCNWIISNNYSWGTQCHPGCANSPSPYAPTHVPGCTAARRDTFAQRFVDHILADPTRRKGRNWLIYNEAENLDQGALDPREAALLFDVLFDRVRAVDPRARFYCCGTMVFDAPRRQWLADFAANLHRPLDGIHYHNYYPPSWYDGAQIIQTMVDFHGFMQGVSSAGGQQLGALDMLITEWSGLFPKDASHRCAGANNRDTVMRPVAQWLNDHGTEHGIVGAAWFGSGWSEWASVSLFDPATRTKTCLGEEYFGYRWGSAP